MPKVTEEQKYSNELRRLFEYSLTLEEIEPVNVDDILLLIDELPENKLILICGNKTLTIQELYRKLYDELVDIELFMPVSHCGWIVELLGLGKVVI